MADFVCPLLSKNISGGLVYQHYCFTDEELDFIINYDSKYRIGRDTGEE